MKHFLIFSMKYTAHRTAYVLTLLILLLFGMTLMIATPTAVQAQETVADFVPLEPSLKSVFIYDSGNLSGFFNNVFRIGVGIAALLAVIMIMIGGFEYLTSNIPGQKSDGKEKIKGAIVGLLLILLSFVILNVINPDITGFRLFNETTTTDSGGSTGAPGVPPQGPPESFIGIIDVDLDEEQCQIEGGKLYLDVVNDVEYCVSSSETTTPAPTPPENSIGVIGVDLDAEQCLIEGGTFFFDEINDIEYCVSS